MDTIQSVALVFLAAVGGFAVKAYFPDLLETKRKKLEREWKERDLTLSTIKDFYTEMMNYMGRERKQENEEMMEILGRILREMEQSKTSLRAIMGILSKGDR